jgi:hypothetical protein
MEIIMQKRLLVLLPYFTEINEYDVNSMNVPILGEPAS